MPSETRNIIFLHGTGQSALSYEYYNLFLPEHSSHCLEYNVQEDFDDIVNRFHKYYVDNLAGEQIHFVCHSYGCLLGMYLASRIDENVENFISLSAPWKGSRTAKWLNLVFRQSKLFQNTRPDSDIIQSLSNLNNNFKITNIVTTGSSGGGNVLAGFGQERNDGLLTVLTQESYPDNFKNVTDIKFALSHNEVLLSYDVVNILKEKIFNE
jgi:triacylglycerol esterase/lipase EstA (alpha/beta hydrolase family)